MKSPVKENQGYDLTNFPRGVGYMPQEDRLNNAMKGEARTGNCQYFPEWLKNCQRRFDEEVQKRVEGYVAMMQHLKTLERRSPRDREGHHAY